MWRGCCWDIMKETWGAWRAGVAEDGEAEEEGHCIPCAQVRSKGRVRIESGSIPVISKCYNYPHGSGALAINVAACGRQSSSHLAQHDITSFYDAQHNLAVLIVLSLSRHVCMTYTAAAASSIDSECGYSEVTQFCSTYPVNSQQTGPHVVSEAYARACHNTPSSRGDDSLNSMMTTALAYDILQQLPD